MPSVRCVLSAIALLLSVAVQAQVYPAKQLRLIVPYPAGGGTDFFARTVGAQLAIQLGQAVAVENRPGAATIIGAELVAKSAPDGYTLLLGDTATFAVNPSLYKKLPYDPSKDLSPVTMTGRFALLLVVNPAKLNAEYRKAIQTPELRQKLIDAGIDPLESSPADASAYIRSEALKWAKVISEGKITVE